MIMHSTIEFHLANLYHHQNEIKVFSHVTPYILFVLMTFLYDLEKVLYCLGQFSDSKFLIGIHYVWKVKKKFTRGP